MRGNRFGFLEAEDERSVLKGCLSLIAPVDPAFLMLRRREVSIAGA